MGPIMKIPVDKVLPNPQQPRKYFDPEHIAGLAQSIKQHGLNDPIWVEDNQDGTYTLVDGECRLRAHKLAGLKNIDAKVRPATNHNGKQRLIDAMTTFVRQDMNPVDEANGYKSMREKGMSVKEISLTLGKTETHIRGRLSISDLEKEIQELISQGLLPFQPKAIDALLSIPHSKTRIQMAQKLAKRKPTIKIIVKACAQYLTAEREIRKARIESNMKTPALEVSGMNEEPPDWDALYQVGKVPPWQKFTDSVMATCDACSLRPIASEATCGDCPVVHLCRRIMEKTK